GARSRRRSVSPLWSRPRPSRFPYPTLFRSALLATPSGTATPVRPGVLGAGREGVHPGAALPSVRSPVADVLARVPGARTSATGRSEEHTSELQSLRHLVCRLLLEKRRQCSW